MNTTLNIPDTVAVSLGRQATFAAIAEGLRRSVLWACFML